MKRLALAPLLVILLIVGVSASTPEAEGIESRDTTATIQQNEEHVLVTALTELRSDIVLEYQKAEQIAANEALRQAIAEHQYIEYVKFVQWVEAVEAAERAAEEARQAQLRAEAEAKKKREQAAQAQASSAPVSGDDWYRLAMCETGGKMDNPNTGNGYYGYFQFSYGTWQSVGGPGYPHHHSYETQKRYAQILQARSGWGQWPACSAKLGLR